MAIKMQQGNTVPGEIWLHSTACLCKYYGSAV